MAYLDETGLSQVWGKIKLGFPQMKCLEIDASDSASFSFSSGSKLVMHSIGGTSSICGEWIVSYDGSITNAAVKSASDISVTISGQTMTVANNNATNAVKICFLVFVGGVEEN